MSWTQCTLECGNGTRVRGKVCVNPRAQYGGQDCEGDPTEIQHCNVDPCPSKLNECYSSLLKYLVFARGNRRLAQCLND